MAEKEKSGLSSLFDGLSKLAAIVVLLALAFRTILLVLGALNVDIPADITTQILGVIDGYILPYGALVLGGLVALEWSFSKGLLASVLVIVLIALIVLPQFFPEVWSQIMSGIGGGAAGE